MEILHSIVLGIVQGLTEFLPISSDGHLVLVRHLLHWNDEGVLFDATLHLGTFFAVLYFYRATWWRLVKTIFRRGTRNDEILLGLLILATIPGALLGFFAKDLLEVYFRGLVITGFGFLFTAVMLYFADKNLANKRKVRSGRLTVPQTIGVGLLQAVALLPGVSRSGSTIAGGVFSNLSREKAVEFSFLMAMPITGGAGFLALLKDFGGGGGAFWPLFVGFVVSFLVGLWAIKFLIRYVATKDSFKPFIVYLMVVAALSFVVAIF
ncbi:MAG: undecaprenyl-diphosphate phosphatase [bacterium]|nr:undecaprenyl-diphosphate phosphatase [bacterium]